MNLLSASKSGEGSALLGCFLNTAQNLLRQRIRKLLNPMDLASFPEPSCIRDPATSVDASRKHLARLAYPIESDVPVRIEISGIGSELGSNNANLNACLAVSGLIKAISTSAAFWEGSPTNELISGTKISSLGAE